MAKANTECTELSVGFGLMNLDPLTTVLSDKEIDGRFEGTLPPIKYRSFRKEFSKKESYYRKFWRIGIDLRNVYPPFHNLSSVRWEGGIQQARSVSMAIDLMAANTAISVKADSNILSNLSIHTLFVSLPVGGPPLSRSENWYNKIAPAEYQEYYSYARNQWMPSYPENVSDYLAKIKGAEKRKLLGKKMSEDDRKLNALYLRMCHKVAEESATLFNVAVQQSFNSGIRNSVVEKIVKQLFRVGDIPYILCGLDKKKEFAVRIPSLTSWMREWHLRSIEAHPNINAGQSLVEFSLVIENKRTREISTIEFHVEIRWSHGKLNGSPEAKFHKKTQWTNIPFFDLMCDFHEFDRGRFIGSGSFGRVYEAKPPRSRKIVALKELNTQSENEDARERFEAEVRLQKGLQHPNIIPILQYDLSARVPWFTMPLAKMNLSEKTNLMNDLPQINLIFRQLLDGMNHAHKAGVIHRDLKPDNILLDNEDRVQISDFGLGKRPEDSFHLTHSSNNSMGTFSYAAPEQLDSFRDADHRADIYSMGKLLYFLVTQEDPHSMEIERVPEPYRAIILKCTKKEPVQRYQSVEELIADFATCTSASQQ